jgi:hypothetical protein
MNPLPPITRTFIIDAPFGRGSIPSTRHMRESYAFMVWHRERALPTKKQRHRGSPVEDHRLWNL